MSLKEDTQKRVAKNLAFHCVRMTMIERIHRGTYPSSKTGDYSDVKVVSPYGEIPWKDVAHMTDDDMREFMKEVANKLYTVLLRMDADDDGFSDHMNKSANSGTSNWDEPENLKEWLTGKNLEERFGSP